MTTEPEPTDEPTYSRRAVLGAGFGVAAAAVLAACSGGDDRAGTAAGGGQPAGTAAPATEPATSPAAGAAAATTVAPTPECRDDDDVTPAQTEGPYFRASSPEKTNLFADVNGGTRLLLTGTVVTTACQPVNRALVDFWQCDANGNYDNSGYRLRGHQFTDAEGRYQLETVLPGIYPGRTRHIHVKVQAPNGPVLTTQLYFPGEAQNARDGIYRAECEIGNYRDAANGKEGTFGFVVRT